MSRAANKRHNARRDANEPGIVEALRKSGALVDRIDGTGTPDLLVGYQGEWFLLEVKVPDKKPRLTEAEAAWHERAIGYPVAIVQTPEEALAAIGATGRYWEALADMPAALTGSVYRFVPPDSDNWFGV